MNDDRYFDVINRSTHANFHIDMTKLYDDYYTVEMVNGDRTNVNVVLPDDDNSGSNNDDNTNNNNGGNNGNTDNIGDTTSKFPVYSITKSVLSAIFGQLIDQRIIKDEYDKIDKYLDLTSIKDPEIKTQIKIDRARAFFVKVVTTHLSTHGSTLSTLLCFC